MPTRTLQAIRTGLLAACLTVAAFGLFSTIAAAQEVPPTRPTNTMAPVTDPSIIVAANVVTIVKPHEDYLTFEQAWSFETNGASVYAPPDDPEEGFEVYLPEGAEGVHVYEPQRGATASDSSVRVRLPVGPSGSGRTGNYDLIYRFSLPNTSPSHRYEQRMSMPVLNSVVIVPQETTFQRFPTIEVELNVPLCESDSAANFVCYDSVESTPVWDPVNDQDRRIARMGHGGSGSTLLFETAGWPAPNRTVPRVAAIGFVALFVLGALFAAGQRRNAKDSLFAAESSKATLESEKRRLLATLREVQRQFEHGLLPKSEYDLQDLVLRRKLENVYAALEPKADS